MSAALYEDLEMKYTTPTVHRQAGLLKTNGLPALRHTTKPWHRLLCGDAALLDDALPLRSLVLRMRRQVRDMVKAGGA